MWTTTFAEHYEALASRKKVIKELKDAAKGVSNIYIATDPDREGEAIGWHLIEELKGKIADVSSLDLQRDHEEGDSGRAQTS